MIETKIDIGNINPIEFYGVDNKRLKYIHKFFPKIKLSARGNELIAKGDEDVLDVFSNKIKELLDHYEKYNILTDSNIERILTEDSPNITNPNNLSDIILYGNYGKIIKARTPNQAKLVEKCIKNDLVFAVGPAGSGKTYTAIALAVRALRNREVKKIIISRPVVEAGENLGFLPGDIKEKIDPYLQPIYDALGDMIPSKKLQDYLESETIQIAPLAYMRGRTLNDAFVVLDEAQNTTNLQLKMFLTRMGKSAKFIVTGDMTQIDLPKMNMSGLKEAFRILKGIKGIEFIEFDTSDIIRHRLVKEIVKAYAKES
ncbi:MAG: PhoH family protein [Marinifilaceae bacterium]|jgi:phosphate starvation-inducible PhoH-like protein|nr:PhoH family protein [Marinilabiliaceae bacterium JC040]MCT4599551.1 PhoH family protein [Marinifilaceae bacterium]